MLETILKYISVYLLSMFKFGFGPATGALSELPVLGTALSTILGMMTTVVIILLLGSKRRLWLMNKLGIDRRIEKSSYRTRRLWENYGVLGIAFLTPLLFTPIIGSFLAMMVEASRPKIVKYMLISAIFWGLILSYLVDQGVSILGF